MWSELREDVEFYAALHYPGTSGPLRRTLVCFRSLGLFVLAVQRLDHYYNIKRRQVGWTLGTIALKLVLLCGRAIEITVAKSDIADTTVIAGGVYLSDHGHLTMGPQSIGRGTVIHERVSIGVKAGGNKIKPSIGENVWIGPDCVIYGEISIADGATVLPGTVLSMSVPARALVGGNPATILRKDFDNTHLRQTLSTQVDGSLSAVVA